MGSNSVSHMANISPHIYEKAHIEHLIDDGNLDIIKNLDFPFNTKTIFSHLETAMLMKNF